MAAPQDGKCWYVYYSKDRGATWQLFLHKPQERGRTLWQLAMHAHVRHRTKQIKAAQMACTTAPKAQVTADFFNDCQETLSFEELKALF